MAGLLPSHDGLLPKWLMLVAVTSIGNSIQAYSTLTYTQRLYAGPPPKASSASYSSSSSSSSTNTNISSHVNPLAARLFGTWTTLASIVRWYAAYHIDEPAWYQLALWTYVVAFAHFMSEMAIFQTARPRGPWLAPAMVATGSLIWMTMQYGYYVK